MMVWYKSIICVIGVSKQLVATLFLLSSVLMTGFGCAILLRANCLEFCALSLERGGQCIGLATVFVFVIALITGQSAVCRRCSVGWYALTISHPLVVVLNLLSMWFLPVAGIGCLVLATALASVLVCLWLLLRFHLLFNSTRFCLGMVVIFLVFQLTFWWVVILQE